MKSSTCSILIRKKTFNIFKYYMYEIREMEDFCRAVLLSQPVYRIFKYLVVIPDHQDFSNEPFFFSNEEYQSIFKYDEKWLEISRNSKEMTVDQLLERYPNNIKVMETFNIRY